MKKKRICKCGSGKELEKGKQKCPDCNPKLKKRPGVEKDPDARVLAHITGKTVTIDLSARPEIAMRIHQLARENFRTVDMQVLYMLNQEFEHSGGK